MSDTLIYMWDILYLIHFIVHHFIVILNHQFSMLIELCVIIHAEKREENGRSKYDDRSGSPFEINISESHSKDSHIRALVCTK